MQQGQLERSSNWMEDFPLWVWLLESNLQLSFAKLGKTMQNPPVFGLNISQTMTIINHLTRKTFLQDWLNSPLQNLTLSWLINHFRWVFYGLVWGNINKPWILPQEQRWGNGGYFGFVWKLGTSKNLMLIISYYHHCPLPKWPCFGSMKIRMIYPLHIPKRSQSHHPSF